MIYVIIDKHSLNNSMIEAAMDCGQGEPTIIFKDDDGMIPSDYLFIQLSDIYCNLFTGVIKLSAEELYSNIEDIKNDIEIKTRKDGIHTAYVITK